MKTKQEQMKKALLDARAICELAETEKRDFTAEERTKVAGMLADASRLKAEIADAKKDAGMQAQIMALLGDFAADEQGEQPAAPAGKTGSMGARFVASPQLKAWLQRVAPSGRIPDSTRGLVSPPVMFESMLKDLVTGVSDASAGAFVETDYTGIYEPLGRYPLNALGLFARRTTTSDLVEFVRQTLRVQQAAPTAESNVTTDSGATGEISGEKPEGAMEFEKVQEPVKTIAVWIPATKRALSDAAQIRGIIDQELHDDLMEELEDQLLNGNGVGENFTGVFNTAGILTQAWDTDLLTTSRKAITYLQVTGRSRATAWVLHPEDWETVELLQDGENRYYWGGPMVQGRAQLWSIPVVTSQSLTQGTALLGDFRKGVIWDREAASIQVSDSHSDFFIRNMVAILAEMRAAFGVIRPSAFVAVDMENGS